MISNNPLILIDCGSSGSRVFSYNNYTLQNSYKKQLALGVLFDEFLLTKNYNLLNDYLKNLLFEVSLNKSEIYLFATAGLRKFTIEKQDFIMKYCCDFIKNNYEFIILNCKDQFKVISGIDEGMYGICCFY